jgi:hypothetical protein
MIQPMADDLYWIQIEDFVDIFNRVFMVMDLMFERKAMSRRFLSKWLPGDPLVGSAGPPVIIEKHEIQLTEEELAAQQTMTNTNMNSNNSNINSTTHPSRPQSADSAITTTSSNQFPSPFLAPKKKIEKKYEKVAYLNEEFVNNPMFPFTVTEPSRIVIALYQLDKRWNTSRLNEDSTRVSLRAFIPRKQRLQEVMNYPIGISFLILRLHALNLRVHEFHLNKIAYTPAHVSFNVANQHHVELFPGRYAIVPYTHSKLDRLMDYALHVQYFGHQIEWEIEDPIVQRLQDNKYQISEELEEIRNQQENSKVELPEDNDLLHVVNEETDDVTILSFEKVPNTDFNQEDQEEEEEDEGENKGEVEDKVLASKVPQGIPSLPKMLKFQPWEYTEDIDEFSMITMYGEVGNMMKYLRNMKDEIRKLNGTIRALNAANDAGGVVGGMSSPGKVIRIVTQQQNAVNTANSNTAKLPKTLSSENKLLSVNRRYEKKEDK